MTKRDELLVSEKRRRLTNDQSAGSKIDHPRERRSPKRSRDQKSKHRRNPNWRRHQSQKIQGQKRHEIQCSSPGHAGRERKDCHRHALIDSDQEGDRTKIILEWDSPVDYVPLREEESMVQFMFKRNGKRERGMLKGKPSFLVGKFIKAMHQYAPTMNLSQVLSLRRHHIKHFNEFQTMTQLGLGERHDIDKSARLFEIAIETFLKKSSIDFLTEEDQKRMAAEEKKVLKATPDFVLPRPIVLRKIRRKVPNEGKLTRVLEERTINWIEAKMYFGASSIPHGSKGAIGSILKKSQKYVDHFGEGAIIFMMGCGEQLATEMNAVGVSVLDCSGNTVSLQKVYEHQRTWCANGKGQILP